MFKKFKQNKLIKCKNIDKNNKKSEYIKKLIESRKLPLAVLDPLWYEMKQAIKTNELDYKEKILNEFIREKGKLTTDIQEYEKVKQNALQKVLQLSDEIQAQQENVKMKALEKTRQIVIKTNEIIQNNERRLEELEILIDKANKSLLEEAIEIGYMQMEEYRIHKQALEREIDELRKQVVIKTEQKKAYDKQFGVTYNYLHKIVGYKDIDKVDKELGEEKE